MNYQRLTTELWEPVTLAEARMHLNLYPDQDDTHPDDDLVYSLITSAREIVEHDSGFCLVKSTWYGFVNSWPRELIIQKVPVTKITKVEYWPQGGTDYAEFDKSNYHADIVGKPARIMPANSWPTADTRYNAIRISFDAGYESIADVPYLAKSLIKIKLGHLYETRQEVVPGTITEIPRSYDDLINKIRLYLLA